MSQANRPLSPHLQIYRPQITSVLSILHRLTGVALALGLVMLVWWLEAAALGVAPFDDVQAFAGSFLGRLLLFGWSFSLFYHLSNGIRHLFWDAGLCYELATVHRTGWAVVIAAVVLTLIAWIAGYSVLGGAG